MHAAPRWLAGVVILVLIGPPATTGAIQDDGRLDPRAPARFSLDFVEEGRAELVWTQADGYRESWIAPMTSVVEATDPRIGGTLTMASVLRQFTPPGEGDQVFNVAVGTLRIDNLGGSWVGTFQGLGAQDSAYGRILLEGAGAYEGLTALIRMGEYDGVIFDHGLPPLPDPIEPSAAAARQSAGPLATIGTGVDRPGGPRIELDRADPTAPATFTVEVTEESRDVTWTEADGYRQATFSDYASTLQASDPRVSGTLTMSWIGREFAPEDRDESFGVYVGTARLDDADGAWVGTFDGFWTDDCHEGMIRLEGEGTNEGLTAFILIEQDGGGVLFGHGLPPMPSPVEPPGVDAQLPRPTTGASPTTSPDVSWVLVPEGSAPPQALRHGRSLGDPGAPVRIDVYQDAQCPPCARFSEDIGPLLIAGPVAEGEVFLTYRDCALLGQESIDAAVGMRVAEALGGRFWDYEQVLYHNQGRENSGDFSLERLADIADAIGIDREAFLREMQDPTYLEGVQAETAEARELGIDGVPSLVIDGDILVGLPTWEELEAAIDAAIAQDGS
jgi:predicted DsbA family dithiol-disulfide isomerase